MQVRVEKWGDGLALRIPPALAAETGLAEDTVIDVAVIAGKLVVTPAPRKPTLDELLRAITPDNLHGEWDTGPATGEEAW